MSEPVKIDIALHTLPHAKRLGNLLEKEGIKVYYSPARLTSKLIDVPVVLSIAETDIPQALRIIENIEIFPLEEEQGNENVQRRKKPKDIILGKKTTSKNPKKMVLLPVDFSDYSFQAARVAFSIADKHGAGVMLLHAYVLPSRTDNLGLTADVNEYEPVDAELEVTMEETAMEQMKTFISRLKDYIKEGVIPPVKFEKEILEGIPETVINDYARDNEPMLIVMGTRGVDKKEKELVGSVTAEVLDNCRFPAFTVPETTGPMLSLDKIHDVTFFCNLDSDDAAAIDVLYSLFPDGQFKITLLHIPSRRERLSGTNTMLEMLTDYCREHYKGYTFSSLELTPEQLKEKESSGDIYRTTQFMVVPNKRKNALARLFNPGLAHRLLFHTDIPMLVVPV